MVGVCGIVFNEEGKLLLMKHKKKTPWYGYWIIPGGKLEFGESLENCIRREIKEEFGIEIKIEKLVTALVSKESEKVKHPIVLIFFLSKALSNELRIKEDEVKEAGWFSLEEIERMNLHEDTLLALEKAGLLSR